MDVLKVVQQLRDLAADPQNRATIVRDQGCLPGLVIFLDNDNPHVVITALEALYYLAQVPSNRPLMKNEVGLLVSVRRIINRQHSSPELKSSAQKVHDLLIPQAGSARPLSQSRSSVRGNVFLGASNRKARVVILQIDGLRDQASRHLVEEQLLSVKGVVSFTFNMPQHRCVVRMRTDLKAETLCRAIAATERLSAQQVVKNEHGEEVFLSFTPTVSSALDEKENTKPSKLPPYLPEVEKVAEDDKAIEKSGVVEQGGGWFSSVSRFLSESFYW